MKQQIAEAFNYATTKCGGKEITPRFITEVDNFIKCRNDRRYKVKFKAASNTSALVEYQGRRYYVWFGWTNSSYVCEND